MRLWLAAGILFFALILTCGTEHRVNKRQAFQARGGIVNRQQARDRQAVSTAAPEEETEEEETYEDEEDYEPTPAPISYARRPVSTSTQERKPPVSSFRNSPGTGIRNRPQVEVTSETYEDESSEEDDPSSGPTPPAPRFPQRRPYVPDPNNENPDGGGYIAPPNTTPAPVLTTTRAQPQSPIRRGPSTRLANRNLRGPSLRVADSTTEKASVATPATAAPRSPLSRSNRRGSSRITTSTTTTTTEAALSEEDYDEATPAPPPPPIRRVSIQGRQNRPDQGRRRPGTFTLSKPAENKPPTRPPRRQASGSNRIRAPKPTVVLERPSRYDDEDDEEEEQSIPRKVTQRPPRTTTTTTTTAKPKSKYSSRFGNSSRQATTTDSSNKQFRGRFRPKVAAAEDEDDEDSYEAPRRRGSKDRSRSRGRYQESEEDEEDDYDDYEDNPPRRNNNRNRGGSRQRPRNRKFNKGGRGPTTSPRPSTRVPPIDLEVRNDGRIVDYLGDPNLPRELSGYNLVEYPFYITVPEDITFDCDERHDGFYASVPHFCQVFHYCHAGNRYSFLCPNYTLYDQTTFTCRYANTVDCKRSANHYSRNDDLYKDKDAVKESITTQLIPTPTKATPTKATTEKATTEKTTAASDKKIIPKS